MIVMDYHPATKLVFVNGNAEINKVKFISASPLTKQAIKNIINIPHRGIVYNQEE
jgi:hypothetical protein